jgi:glycosyltransferase involved in cell wall biosynthesis
MPTVALEALAAGVPVVASRVGGLAELPGPAVRHVTPDDPQALALAIELALVDTLPPHQLQAAVADLDWAKVATRLAPCLRDA